MKIALKEKIQKSLGFTLVELMIVIAIMGVIIALSLSSYLTTVKKGRDSQRKNDLKQISQALEMYNNDKGRYPASDANGRIVGCTTSTSSSTLVACEWGVDFKDVYNNVTYMVRMPKDPSTSNQYFYYYNQSRYQLYSKLENEQDGALSQKDDGSGVKTYTGTNCCSGDSCECNYGISSTNVLPEEIGHTYQ